MGKHTDAVKPFTEFRAPWETETGDEADIDKPKLKRYIYNLVTDKAKAQDSREDAVEKVSTLEKDLEEAKKEAASASGEEATRKIEKLERDLAAAKTKVTELETAKEQADLRSEVLAGLDPKVAKYVQGTTREELEKSLEEVKADFGISDEPAEDEDEDEDDDDSVTLRTRPRALTNPADRASGPKGGETDVIDFDKVADGIVGNGIWG